MIIGLIGQKRVGKDTVANIIKEIDPEYKTFALADPIKDIARIMFNFTEEQLYNSEKDLIAEKWNIKPRDFFEKFGTEIMQFDIYNYLPGLKSTIPQRKFWVLSLLAKINKNDKIIITDIRGQHEIEEIIKFNNNAKFIHIIRPSIQYNNINDYTQHLTQLEANNIDKQYISHTIINDSTVEQLHEKIKKIFETI